MLIIVLFIVVDTWKQSKSPPVEHWIHPGNGILFSAKKTLSRLENLSAC